MKTLYLDIFSGISGDMLLGALIDLGVDPHKLERELKKLKLEGYHLHFARKQKSGIEGVKFDVHLADGNDHDHDRHHHDDHEHEHTHAPEYSHTHEHEYGGDGGPLVARWLRCWVPQPGGVVVIVFEL